jgi:hypothetical protein
VFRESPFEVTSATTYILQAAWTDSRRHGWVLSRRK